ncbi:Cyclic AMP-responsive element-binding protein 5 [Triplophysa tibetana]|uniref:Cyclic AMP-responsive element-binding protein 5 n=1 Tax=Triplophysa tibetana TaxID=1572043 RepID=A0A5A9N1N7_9TELE|nr:Cyclic AMP-responsive element-binding protein 5 [Triplophysa tibetana]
MAAEVLKDSLGVRRVAKDQQFIDTLTWVLCVWVYEEPVTVMNSEQERPFMCSAPGCSQRFPTEDHLMIHRHKHEMTLKFPSIKHDNMLSDQTPTPTRFLKNCEEVGLFSELACSIEQEFCKAQEEEDSKQNISLHGQGGPNQHQQTLSRMANHDSSIVIQQALPSPQSSSVITQAPSTNRQIGPIAMETAPPSPSGWNRAPGCFGYIHTEQKKKRNVFAPSLLQCLPKPVPGSLSSLLHLRNRQRQPLPASIPGTLPDPTMQGSSAVLMPMERQMSMSSNMMGMQVPTHNSSCPSPHVPPMHSEAKLCATAPDAGIPSRGNSTQSGRTAREEEIGAQLSRSNQSEAALIDRWHNQSEVFLCTVTPECQRLKAALAHHPGGMSNGSMNSMGHMMEMMSSRQEQSGHHHLHPHQHMQCPPHGYPHHAHHHHPSHVQSSHHHQQNHGHHNSHQPHLHPTHGHQTSPHQSMHSAASQLSPAAQQMQPTQTLHSPPPSGGRRRRVVDEDPDERRRKFLERNRAAATRCRQKRKVWVISLEKKAEELTQTNMQLQNEVTMLKNEVTQLKQLLLTHKDCPITAMQKESQGYLSPESSPAGSPNSVTQQQVIQHNTITTSSTAPNHRTDINPIH